MIEANRSLSNGLNTRFRAKSAVLRSIFRLKRNFAEGARPSIRSSKGVEITAFFEGRQASATISADFEIAWAFRGRSEEERSTRGVRCRKNVPMILRMLEEGEIPITWATVGHLFLERCARDPSGCAHPEMPRPPKNLRWEGDWYRHDPCGDLKSSPHWYAPDLIEQILSSRVSHEIGSHSFSHIDFSESTSTRELVEQELRACIRLMAPKNLDLRSLVYPFNNMGHHYLDLIGELGLTAVRHRDPYVLLSYPVATPSGVYKLYETMNVRRGRYYDYIEKGRIFLDEAVRRQAAYHIWFHPSDPTEWFEREFHGILTYMAALRDQGKLWVATMGELAAYCEARQNAKIQVERASKQITIALRNGYDVKRYGKTALTLRVECDTEPRQCWFWNGAGQEAVSWVADTAGRKGSGSRAVLVNMPATAEKLSISF